jgi:hypothetical protein
VADVRRARSTSPGSRHRRPIVPDLRSFKNEPHPVYIASLSMPVYLAHSLISLLFPSKSHCPISLFPYLCLYILRAARAYVCVCVCVCMTGLLTSFYRIVTHPPAPSTPTRPLSIGFLRVHAVCLHTARFY